MLEVRRRLIVLRGCMVAVCLALLASCGGSGGSADSAPASAPSGASDAAPPAPVGLQATPGNAQAALTWSASTGAASYAVKRSNTSGGPYTQLATATSPSYTDATLSNGTTYYYVVSAVNSVGDSPDSAQASVTPDPTITTPPAPTGLAANAGNAQVSLTWSASTGATSYNVKRATTSGGPYSQVSAPTSTSYTDSSLTNGTTYYYVVSAVNSAGESANSAQASAIPVSPSSNPPPATLGTWVNVTPSNVDLTDPLTCQNFGVESVQVDPTDSAILYAQFHCQGIWKSTDYGATWNGPINTGSHGAAVSDCAGGITIPTNSTASAPTIYEACIRGNGLGFWKSVDGGVNWTSYFVAPAGASRQDYYPPVVDPYDENHLLMAGHEMNYLVESVDGGQNWTNVTLAGGMLEDSSTNSGTGEIFFINTGAAAGTRGTWLWIAQGSGGTYGTWRTANNGATWVQVDKNEHPHGAAQIYQPDNNGTVYMAGIYSASGNGVLRSSNYGQTWTHVGAVATETVVAGTAKNLYAMYGWSIGAGQTLDPTFQVASQPGTGNWVEPGTPASLTQGAHEIRVVNDGTHNVLVSAMGNAGLWRYIEP